MNAPYQKYTADQIIPCLVRHPRVVFQNIASDEEAMKKFKGTLPVLIPFGNAHYHGILPILDWDHRLPSQYAILRIHGYYSEASFYAGKAELDARSKQIEARDKFPEFDVPDFTSLTGDEIYEGSVKADGTITELRLTSSWRRDIDHKYSRIAIQVARQSEQFKKLLAETKNRPDYLGDLEAMNWTPPCESEYESWTIDVWYLLELDASVGKGKSLLVDPEKKLVIGEREFVVRPT